MQNVTGSVAIIPVRDSTNDTATLCTDDLDHKPHEVTEIERLLAEAGIPFVVAQTTPDRDKGFLNPVALFYKGWTINEGWPPLEHEGIIGSVRRMILHLEFQREQDERHKAWLATADK